MAICVVSGTFLDPSENAISGATVRYVVDTPFIGNTAAIISPKEVSTTTATDGTWSLTLTQSSSGTLSLDCPPNGTNSARTYTFGVVVPATSTASFTSVWSDPTNSSSPSNFPLTFAMISGQLASSQLPILASTNLWVGNGSNAATAVAMSGDASLSNAGALTVNTVGGSTAALVHSAELAANAATATPTSNTIVKYDSSGNLSATNLSGTNTGDVTLAAVGSSPSANAASLSGQVLTIQPADATHPGVITAITQTVGGAKTFASTVRTNNASTATGGNNVRTTGDGVFQGLNIESNDSSKVMGVVIHDAGDIFFYDGTVRLSFSSSGKGGTGPSSPLYKWDVTGDDPNTTQTSVGIPSTIAIRNSNSTPGVFSSLAFTNTVPEVDSVIEGVHDIISSGASTGHVDILTSDAGTLGRRLRVNTNGITVTGIVTADQMIDNGVTSDTVLYANSSKKLTSSSVTPTELSYVSGVTSSIQTQINNAAPVAGTGISVTGTTISLSTPVSVDHGGTGLATLTANNVVLGNGTSGVQLIAPGTSGNILTSNGTTWASSAPSTSASVSTLYNVIIGSAAQVTAGTATHSTFVSVSQANGDRVLVLPAYATSEAWTITKKLYITGLGNTSSLDGAITFSTGASNSRITNLRTTADLTINSGITGIYATEIWFSGIHTFVDNNNSGSNILFGLQE